MCLILAILASGAHSTGLDNSAWSPHFHGGLGSALELVQRLNNYPDNFYGWPNGNLSFLFVCFTSAAFSHLRSIIMELRRRIYLRSRHMSLVHNIRRSFQQHLPCWRSLDRHECLVSAQFDPNPLF